MRNIVDVFHSNGFILLSKIDIPNNVDSGFALDFMSKMSHS